jgi:hypothetical protein
MWLLVTLMSLSTELSIAALVTSYCLGDKLTIEVE